MKKVLPATLATLMLAGVIGFVATRTGMTPHAVTSVGVPAMGIPVDGTEGTMARASFDEKAMEQQAAPGVPADVSMISGGGEAANVAAEPYSSVGGVDPKVIKTADLTVEVKADTFEEAFDRASLVAQKYGGFVMSSSTSGDKTKWGNFLLRVPSKSFDLAMSDLRDLGEPKSESVNSQEVTDQFIDLNARLKTWQAQENVLLGLMDKANSISETMTVQRELQQVQYQIEQIKGQLRVLRDQTSYATIALTLREPGVVAPQPKTGQPSLSEAWARAVAGLLGVIYVVVVGLGYLIPVALLAVALWLIVRRFLRPGLAPARQETPA